MRRRRVQLVLAVLAVLILGVSANAGSHKQMVKSEVMSGYHEVPAVSTTGVGQFAAEIDDDAMTIVFELTYSGLEGTAAAAHIHLGQRSVNGGVSAFFCGGGGKPPCPPSGTVTGVIVPSDIIGPAGQGIAPGEFEELVRAIRAGSTYANVHTNKHPGGEIRGQINDPNQREAQ